jgi:hypothetical protein
MLKYVIAAMLVSSSAYAQSNEPAQLTVNQCLQVLSGLNALNYVGQQLPNGGTNEPRPQTTTQYKLGAARMTIALDIAALNAVQNAAQKAQQDIFNEVSGGKPTIQPYTPERGVYDSRITKEVLEKPCTVSPGRIKAADLKLGDGPDQNSIPPAVLSAILPIIDQ